jgi:Zn-dependent peptidase ImmA (M78 family)
MKPYAEISVLGILDDSLGGILKPGMEAITLQRELNIQSVEDIPSAVERAGCEISYVDFPTKVSGASQVIDGTPHIMVNRAKPSIHNAFTIGHELGHHHLHFNPSNDTDPTTQPPDGAKELEANMFGTMFVAPLTCGEQQEQLLAHNPEMRSTLAVSVFATLVAILMAVVIWFCSHLFRMPDSALIQTT